MSKDVSVEVKIAGRSYPLRVAEADEKVLRKAETEINKRLQQLMTSPGARDAQDRLAMVLLTGMVETIKEKSSRDTKLIFLETKLRAINKTLQGVGSEKAE